MATDEPQIKQATSNSAKPPVQIKIQANLIELLDQTKPDHFDRQTWANWLLDTGIRIKLFSDSPENKQQFVEFPKSLGELKGNTTIYINKERKEENTNTTNNYNYYGINPIVEPTTGQPQQKKETDDQKPNNTLEHAANIALEQLRLEEINKPLTEQAKKVAKAIKNQEVHDPAGFDAFWRLYQSCPAPELRVANQSKAKAKEHYRLKLKETSPERLLEAAEKAVTAQMEAQRYQQWIAPLPDAFRWLRDNKWEVFLDQIEERKQRSKDWL